jgi:hypothetical protein
MRRGKRCKSLSDICFGGSNPNGGGGTKSVEENPAASRKNPLPIKNQQPAMPQPISDQRSSNLQ